MVAKQHLDSTVNGTYPFFEVVVHCSENFQSCMFICVLINFGNFLNSKVSDPEKALRKD